MNQPDANGLPHHPGDDAEVSAVRGGLEAMAQQDRQAAPASLEARILIATAPLLARREPVLVLRRSPVAGFSARKLDWPMRVAAVICVMIGGIAVFHGSKGLRNESLITGLDSRLDPEQMLLALSSLERSSTGDQLQRLLMEAATLESMITGNDWDSAEPGDQESM